MFYSFISISINHPIYLKYTQDIVNYYYVKYFQCYLEFKAHYFRYLQINFNPKYFINFDVCLLPIRVFARFHYLLHILKIFIEFY